MSTSKPTKSTPATPITLQQATHWARNYIGLPPDVYKRPHVKLDLFTHLDPDAQGYVTHSCDLTNRRFRLPAGCPVLVLAFDVQHNSMGLFHEGIESFTVHPRLACKGPSAIRSALKEYIAVLRRQAAIKLGDALQLEQVAEEVFEVEWPGYWQEEQPSKLYYVK